MPTGKGRSEGFTTITRCTRLGAIVKAAVESRVFKNPSRSAMLCAHVDECTGTGVSVCIRGVVLLAIRKCAALLPVLIVLKELGCSSRSTFNEDNEEPWS